MTLQASGSMTGQDIRDEMRQTGGNLVFPDATTRWLSEKPTGNVIIPTDFYSKAAIKLTDVDSFTTTNDINYTGAFGPDFPGRTIVAVVGGLAGASVDAHITTFNLNAVSTELGDSRFWSSTTSLVLGIGLGQPTGTSGNVRIIFNTAVSAATVALYAVANRGAVAMSRDGAGSNSATGLSVATVDVPSNGYFAVASLKTNALGANTTLTGANELFDIDIGGSVRFAFGMTNRLATQVNRTGGFSMPAPAAICLLSVCSFG